jgi:hypothetical protein
MKKQLLSIAALLSAASAIAQPTIQANQYNYVSAPGFVYKYLSGQTAISPGASGANVTWDFSTLVGSSTLNYTTASCPGDANCGTFPGANQVIGVSTAAKVYFNKSSNSLEEVGELASGTIVFSDPMKMMQFPVTFNQTFNDSYASSGASGSKNGTLSSTIDAYGTLKTPTGTYTNVLRQKIVENATVVSGSTPLQMTITHYYWIAPGIHHYLMAVLSTQITGLPVPVPTTYVATYTTQSSTPTGIADNEALSQEITVYPNPAKEKLTIQTASLDIKDIEVYNVLGQKMLTQSFTNKSNSASITMDNLQLANGCYFLKINTSKGLVTKQIAIR